MPTTTSDQGIPLPVDADTADNPVIFVSHTAAVEQRLVRLYTDEADRTAKMLTVAENQLSGLGTENRIDAYDGTNHVSLWARGLWGNKRKSANQNVGPSNTTLQNVTDLVVAFPATVNNAVFGFQAVLFYDSATAADIKFAFTIPTGATMQWGMIGPGATTFGDPNFGCVTASGTAITVSGNGVGTPLICAIHGEMTMSTNAGNLQLQAAQGTSDATATTVQARSRLQVWRTV